MEANATDQPAPRKISALLSDQRLILRETKRAVTPFGPGTPHSARGRHRLKRRTTGEVNWWENDGQPAAYLTPSHSATRGHCCRNAMAEMPM